MKTRVATPLRPLAATTVAFLIAAAIASPRPVSFTQTDDSTTFKTETNLVLVPVVVRDASGNEVGNLRKEDFQLFDKGKPQIITKFAVEDTSGQVAEDRSLPDTNGASANHSESAPIAIPSHFVALLFDDLHFKNGGMNPPPGFIGDAGDLMFVRKAALKFLDTLRPADRVAILTTSGQVGLDFTLDRVKLKQALLNLQPGPPVLPNVHSIDAKQIENESDAVLRQCTEIVRRMARLPGQRTVVFVSPGLLGPDQIDMRDLIDLAIRSRVVMNSLDARGLGITSAVRQGFQAFQAQITDGTGGRFIRDTNDLDGSIRQLAATPKYIYILGFSPQTLKPDGSFRPLTVKLVGQKFQLQARKGYYSPDAKELARKNNQPIDTPSDTPQVDEAQTKELTQALGIGTTATTTPVAAEATVMSSLAPPPPLAPSKPSASPAAVGEEEISTHDEPVTFKAQANLVEVPVVVRDHNGNAIGNLAKEDFRLFDKGKRQEITKFSVQRAASPSAANSRAANANAAAASQSSRATNLAQPLYCLRLRRSPYSDRRPPSGP